MGVRSSEGSGRTTRKPCHEKKDEPVLRERCQDQDDSQGLQHSASATGPCPVENRSVLHGLRTEWRESTTGFRALAKEPEVEACTSHRDRHGQRSHPEGALDGLQCFRLRLSPDTLDPCIDPEVGDDAQGDDACDRKHEPLSGSGIGAVNFYHGDCAA